MRAVPERKNRAKNSPEGGRRGFPYTLEDYNSLALCIAPPEVGKYWQVGEEEGGAEGVVWRYACRMAAGCPQGCRRVYAEGCMV